MFAVLKTTDSVEKVWADFSWPERRGWRFRRIGAWVNSPALETYPLGDYSEGIRGFGSINYCGVFLCYDDDGNSVLRDIGENGSVAAHSGWPKRLL